MKKIKSLVAVVCSFTLLFLSTALVFASAQSQSPYDFLLSCGYSASFLDALSEEMLLKIYNAIGDNEVVSVEKTVFGVDEFGGLYPVNTQGAINASSMTITTELAEIVKPNTEPILLCIYAAVWEWAKNKPAIRYEDLYTVNWDVSVFTRGAFYAQDTGRNSDESEPNVINEYDDSAKSALGGLGHYNKLSWKYDYIGGALLVFLTPANPIKIKSNDPTKNSTTEITFNIVHNRNPFGVGITLGYEGNGVTIDAGLLSDSASRSTFLLFQDNKLCRINKGDSIFANSRKNRDSVH